MIRLGTKFSSVDELVTRFSPFVTETTLVMPAVNDVQVGTEGRFIVQLADKTEVMTGRCSVEEIKPAGDSGAGRPIMRLRLLSMDDASRKIHARLLAWKRAVPAPAPPVAARKPPPLRIVPAPTLIGAPPFTLPLAEAAPMPVAEDKIEPTERNRWLAAESRAPAAALTLPANPLSELGEDDLASFIECTLFESTGESSPAEDADEQTTAGPVLLEEKSAAPAVPAPVTATAAPRATPARVASVVTHEATSRYRIPQLRRGLMQAAPYALCTVIGVLAGSLLRGSPAAPPTPAAVAPVAPAAAPVAPAPAPVAATPPPPVAREPAPSAAPEERQAAAPAAADCVASITTEPRAASVLWGTMELGRTPIRSARVPCGDATVVLRHERYRDVRRDVSATPGRTASISERFKRPMAMLALSSTPAHAAFTVNHLPVGPGAVSVMRFEHLRVDASLPGYKPWSQTVYVKEPTAKVVAQLVALPKPVIRPVVRNVPAPRPVATAPRPAAPAPVPATAPRPAATAPAPRR